MRPRQGRESCQNMYKLKEKDKTEFYSLAEKCVLPVASTKRARRKRVCGRFQSKYASGQPERPEICRIGDHEDIEVSDDRDDGQRLGANKRRGHGVRQRIGLVRDSNAS